MKICFVCPLPPPYGGISNWYLQLSKYVSENYSQQVRCSVISPPIASRNDAQGRTLFERVYYGGIGAIQTFFRVSRFIKKDRPDVVHITTSAQLALIRDFLILKVAKKRKVPTVYHIHMGRASEIAQANTFEWKMLKKCASLASSVWVLDRTTQQTFESYLPNVDVQRMPNPIVVDSLQQISAGRDKEKTIVFVGWVVKTKGVEELLDSWASLVDQFPDYVLKLIGPYKKDYLDYLQKTYSMKNAFIQGEVEHELALNEIAKASLLVLPSYTEAFPNVVLEAMALKTPVLATSVGAIPDMLGSGCGVLVKPQDSEQLLIEMRKLLSSPSLRDQTSEDAFLKIRNEFDITTVFRRYWNSWRDVVDQVVNQI